MKNYIIIAFLFFYSYSNSQTNSIIEVNPKKEVYIFFKSQIITGESLPNPALFKFDKEKPTSIGIATGEKNQDANLLVTTKDGLTYSFSLKYKKHLRKLNYFIEKKDATNYSNDMDKEVASDKKEMTIDKNGLIVLKGETKKTKEEVDNDVDKEALEIAKLEKEKLERDIKNEKEAAKKEAAALKKIEKEKAKAAKELKKAKRKKEKALRDAERKRERALRDEERKKNAALKKEQKAIKKKELALQKEKKRLAKKEKVAKKEVKNQEQEVKEPEMVEEVVAKDKNIVSNQNEVDKKIAIPSSAVDVSVGMADGGFGLNLSFNKMLKKGYMKYGLNGAFSKIKSSLSQTDVSLGTYTFDLGYYYPLIHKTNVNMSVGGGGLLGYETLNKGKVEVDAANNFIYGAYIGTEFAYRFTDKMGVLLKYNQNFYLNSDIGNTAPYIGLGLRFYTNKKN